MRKEGSTVTTENKMANERLLPLIIKMSLPTIFTMIVISLYNIVDSVYISHLSAKALTALSLAFPVQTVIAAVASGVGTGVCVLAAQRLGAGNEKEASVYVSQGTMTAIVLGVMTLSLSLIIPRGYIQAFSSSETIVSQGSIYLAICMGFSFAVFLQTVFEKVLQASGNMIWPMYFGVGGLILNLVLDPVMIFGLAGFPALGITGAAIATGISQTVSMGAALAVVMSKVNPLKPSLKEFRPRAEAQKQIFSIALPIIIQQAMSAVTNGLMNKILIGFGEVAVNVYSIFFRLQNVFMKPVLGINTSVLPILSFNYGAGNIGRLRETLKKGTVMGVLLLTIGMIPFLFFPEVMLRLFNADQEMIEAGIPAFRIMSLYFPLAGATIVISAVFSALAKSIYSMYVSLIRQALVLLPAAWMLSKISLQSTWWCYLIAEGVATALCAGLYIKLYREKIVQLQKNSSVENRKVKDTDRDEIIAITDPEKA